MTIIVFKEGILAADTLLVSNVDAVAGEAMKIGMCEGFMGGATGNVIETAAFLEWVENGADWAKYPEFKDPFTGLIINRENVVWHGGKGGISRPVIAPFHAIGSGEEVAKGALGAGATAKEAVQVAISIDLFCGGHVDTLRFE